MDSVGCVGLILWHPLPFAASIRKSFAARLFFEKSLNCGAFQTFAPKKRARQSVFSSTESSRKEREKS